MRDEKEMKGMSEGGREGRGRGGGRGLANLVMSSERISFFIRRVIISPAKRPYNYISYSHTVLPYLIQTYSYTHIHVPHKTILPYIIQTYTHTP